MVGDNTYAFLVKRGIKTVGDLAAVPVEILENLLGKHGTSLWEKANGICNRQVESSYSRKSISQETTFFDDVSDKEHLLGVLSAMTEKLCYKIRSTNMVSSCVAIKFRYPDFTTHTQQLAIDPTNSDTIISEAVRKLFYLIHRNEKLRLIGVRLGNLSNEKSQLNLFGNAEKELQKLKAIDSIRNKYGWKSVVNASSATDFR
ncbi:DNA polymerase IV [compost metagenome]